MYMICTMGIILPAWFDSDIGTIGSVLVATEFKERTALR